MPIESAPRRGRRFATFDLRSIRRQTTAKREGEGEGRVEPKVEALIADPPRQPENWGMSYTQQRHFAAIRSWLEA